MEKQINVTREELDDFKREIDSIRSTIEIIQDRDMMDEIIESESNRGEGKFIKKLEI